MKRLLIAVILVLSAVTFSGCNTVEGIGKDIQKAGDAIEKSAK